ncbi:helix-turn-helix transcriptional regulator [Limnohabitans sp.]|jgi:DNA-binding CsgD family transcriptional regulator/PAS domain-containing protein|uniref:helix-turn-helix transcriptional regulator n=1 Tax=Limnohabitans sp. TaxID=1907725 RepID=UPI002FDC9AC6
MTDSPSIFKPGIKTSQEFLSQILGTVYDAALDEAAWVHCLDTIRSGFSANYASLIVRAETSEDVGLIVSAGDDQPNLDPGNPYIAMSPFAGMMPDHIVTLGDVISERNWRNSDYYLSYCKPQNVFHVMAADILTRNGGIYGLRITRPETAEGFSKVEIDFCQLLIPHIKRALNLHLSINEDRKVSSLYSQAMSQLMVGVVILGQDLQVIECNPAATALLEMKDGLRLVGQHLEADYPNDNRKLQSLLLEAMDKTVGSKASLNQAMSVSRSSGRLAWGLIVQSIASDQWTEGKQRPCVAIFLRDTEGRVDPPVRLAQQLFQLTPAETALAIQLANGLSLEEASEALNIRRNTARAHLRSIFSKTGVRRQTELVRIFLNSVAWLSEVR